MLRLRLPAPLSPQSDHEIETAYRAPTYGPRARMATSKCPAACHAGPRDEHNIPITDKRLLR